MAPPSGTEGGIDVNELRTALCDLLGIRYPILQSGMGGVAGPELVAEVSRAGGLGILAGLRLSKDQLRQGVRRVRELTDRPFGVNLWLHTAIRPPADPATLPEETVRRVQGTLDTFRGQLGIPSRTERPAPVPDVIDEAFEVILDERVPVWSIGLGNPRRDMVARCHERGIKIIAMVATVDDARAVVASGVDAVVAQGSEAGGHRSTWVKPASRDAAQVGAMALIPQIVDAVKVPVIAAGGIADGRGIVAALALGAVGALLGTRFVATRDSVAADFFKKALLERGSDATTVTDVFTGLYARTLKNTFTDQYAASGAPVLPALLQTMAAQDIYAAAAQQQNREYFPMHAGQSVGLVHDLPGAAEVVETLVREARAALRALGERVQLG
jgi:nitronate monooxygenase